VKLFDLARAQLRVRKLEEILKRRDRRIDDLDRELAHTVRHIRRLEARLIASRHARRGDWEKSNV
jgi:hypothetical protein